MRRAVLKRVEGGQRLDLIAEKVAEAAMNGDDKAYREIGDRLDGKSTQQIEAVVTDNRMVAELPATANGYDAWAAQHKPH